MADQSAGELLRAKRVSLKLSLRQVEVDTKIRGKFLTKLEAGDYSELPNDIYTKGFVAKYAEYLGLDVAVLVNDYLRERGGFIETTNQGSIKPVKGRRVVLTPRLLVLGTFMGVLLLILGYLGLQFMALAAAPQLTLTTPTSDQAIDGSLVDVNGHASSGADVYVNESPLLTDGNGNFSGQLALQQGVNTITVSAKNKLGKTTSITRNILVRTSVTDLVPTAAFDGVAVGVQIKDSATALTITADGKEVFRGTMLAGTSQLFKATAIITITTSNAGATHLVVTNAVVAAKDLGTIGSNGESKRNLEFAKDTNFQ